MFHKYPIIYEANARTWIWVRSISKMLRKVNRAALRLSTMIHVKDIKGNMTTLGLDSLINAC